MKEKIIILALFCISGISIFATEKTNIIPRSEHYTTKNGLASNVVNYAIQDSKGYLWFGTNIGLTRFDGYEFVNFYREIDGEQTIGRITYISEDEKNQRLILKGKEENALSFDLKTMKFGDTLPFKISDNILDDLSCTRRAERLGIQAFGYNWRHQRYHMIKADNGLEIYTTIDNGIYIHDPLTGELQHLTASTPSSIIQSDYINSILKDRSGSIWLTTSYGGIHQLIFCGYELNNHVLKPSSDSPKVSSVRSFSQLSDKEVAISDMGGNLYRYNIDTEKYSLIYKNQYGIYCTTTDKKGRFWIGTRGDGVFLDGKNLSETSGLKAKQIYDICFGTDGIVYFGTFDYGLIEAREGKDGIFTFTSYLDKESIHDLEFDKKGRLWIATENGVFVKEGNSTRCIYDNGKVVCLCSTSKDEMLVGTTGLGIIHMALEGKEVKKSFTNMADGLVNNNIKAISITNNDSIIVVATNSGISIINLRNGNINNVYSPQAMMDDAYNENAIYQTQDGRIFAGYVHGFVELDKQFLEAPPRYKKQNLVVHITSLEVDNIPIYKRDFDEQYLEFDENNLQITFSIFNYKHLYSTIFQYWLEGFDEDWQPTTNLNSAIYNNLSPGHYRFHVRASIGGGTWGDETVFDIYIAHAWWWTWWMRVIYCLILAIFIWYEWRQYQRRLKLRRQLDQRLSALYAAEAKLNQALEQQVQKEVETNVEDSENSEEEDNALSDIEKSKRQDKEFFDKLDHIIISNMLLEKLDIAFIASEMCMSHVTLYRRIKSLTGITANEYIRKHRLAKAMQLLQDGKNVTEVSVKCGFSTPNYFARCFKAEYGINPSEVGK